MSQFALLFPGERGTFSSLNTMDLFLGSVEAGHDPGQKL